MFNPKSNNLLDDQLAFSGLEMNWVGAAIGAATSIVGGIMGSNQASKQNAANKKAQKKQQKLLDEQAKLQNEYNEKKFEVDKENYYKQANYNFETAVQDWMYKTSIRSLQERTDLRKYYMNVQNSNQQLGFNALAESQGLSREQLAIEDARTENAFQRQDLLVAELQASGKAALGQAGQSRNKAMQANVAQIGRDIAVMDASLTGEIQQSMLNMFDIRFGRYTADARVNAARMLKPESLPAIPAPTMPPEPTWLEPMKIIPGMAAPAQQQSVMAPLIQGIGSAASSIASIDFNPTKTQQDTFKPGSFNFPSNADLYNSNYTLPPN